MENMDSDDILKAFEDKLNDLAFESAKISLTRDNDFQGNDPAEIAISLLGRFSNAYDFLAKELRRERDGKEQQAKQNFAHGRFG